MSNTLELIVGSSVEIDGLDEVMVQWGGERLSQNPRQHRFENIMLTEGPVARHLLMHLPKALRNSGRSLALPEGIVGEIVAGRMRKETQQVDNLLAVASRVGPCVLVFESATGSASKETVNLEDQSVTEVLMRFLRNDRRPQLLIVVADGGTHRL